MWRRRDAVPASPPAPPEHPDRPECGPRSRTRCGRKRLIDLFQLISSSARLVPKPGAILIHAD
jgi:hypothetical protein